MLANELNQPLGGIVNTASAGPTFTAKWRTDVPMFDELFEDIVADAAFLLHHRANAALDLACPT